MLYPGPQLRLLILLALTLPVGLGVREWRAGFPDAAERLERFDPEDPAPLLPEPASVPAGPTAAGSRRPGSPATSPAPPAAATPPPSPPPEPLDVNHADSAALARLPGVGAGMAQRIVAERERRASGEASSAPCRARSARCVSGTRPLIEASRPVRD